MLRGINRQIIFDDDEDRERFLETIVRYKKEIDFELYAYCLIDNHVHLLVKENEIELSIMMKKIATSYAYYFNFKYGRTGHLFQDRYKSEAVEDYKYLYTVIRYIHQNPVKAGMSSMEDYKWSSYKEYIDEAFVIDKDFFMEILDTDRKKAIDKYIVFMNEFNEDECLEVSESDRTTDEKVHNMIKAIGKLEIISEISKLGEDKRIEILRKAKEIEGVSVSQLARVTGINRFKLAKMLNGDGSRC